MSTIQNLSIEIVILFFMLLKRLYGNWNILNIANLYTITRKGDNLFFLDIKLENGTSWLNIFVVFVHLFLLEFRFNCFPIKLLIFEHFQAHEVNNYSLYWQETSCIMGHDNQAIRYWEWYMVRGIYCGVRHEF